MWVMLQADKSDVLSGVGACRVIRRILEEIMKSFLIASALLASAAANATPVEEMVAQGFSCSSATETHVICRKDGQPSKICNTEGSCFRIIYEAGITRADPIKTGSILGYSGLRN
jgi:hypothetical protein